MLKNDTRETLHEIFKPIVNGIDRLVSEQVSQARLKRARDHHAKGDKINVRDLA